MKLSAYISKVFSFDVEISGLLKLTLTPLYMYVFLTSEKSEGCKLLYGVSDIMKSKNLISFVSQTGLITNKFSGFSS